MAILEYDSHQPGDPPIPDLSAWKELPKDPILRDGMTHAIGVGNNVYRIFTDGGRWGWLYYNDQRQGEDGFATPDEALADLRRFRDEQIERARPRSLA